LDPGDTYYFKAQSVDFARNRSVASNEVSAKAGALTPDGFTAVVGNALVTTDGGGTERVVVGDLSGRIWRGQPLPPGTYGLWTDNGYFSGELDANIVRYENLDVVFAKITNIVAPSNAVLEYVAQNKDEWNVIRIPGAFSESNVRSL